MLCERRVQEKTPMPRLLPTSLIGLALLLASCQGETEETPDITEAIPLDADGASTGDAVANGEGEEAASGDTPNLPGEPSAGERSLSDTMESGSNPPEMTEPPEGSKVQRIG